MDTDEDSPEQWCLLCKLEKHPHDHDRPCPNPECTCGGFNFFSAVSNGHK